MNRSISYLSSFGVEILKISKPLSPNSHFFLSVFFLFKFLGIIIFSAAFELPSTNLLSTAYLLRKITVFDNLSLIDSPLMQYEYPLFPLYIVLLLPIVLWIFIVCKRPPKNLSNQIIEESLEKQMVLSTKIATYIFIVIVFLSQHLIEFLCLPICLLFPSSVFANQSLASILSSLKLANNSKPIIYTIINLLYVIVINVYVWFYFKWFNYPFLTNTYLFKDSHNHYFLYLLFIAFNFQAFHYYSFFNETFINVLSGLALIFSVLLILTSILGFIEKIFYNYLIHSMILYAVYNSLISAVSYYIMKDQSEQFFWKNCIIGILIAGTNYLITVLQEKNFNKRIINNLMIKHKQIKGNYLFQLTRLLKECYEDTRNFALLLELIEESQNMHENHHRSTELEIINLKTLSCQLKESEVMFKELNVHKRQMQFKEKFNIFLVLIETEIVNYIANLYRSKKIKEQAKILILHCDFVFYFKLNHSFSLYLIHQYKTKIKEISFDERCQFYSLKNHILTEKNNIKIKIRQSPEYTTDLSKVKFSNFLNYFQILENIKGLLFQCSTDYQKVIGLKNYCSDIKYQKQSMEKKNTFENLFLNCMEIDSSLSLLKKTIIDNFGELPLKNPEICYLLRNFYDITHKNIPNSILSCISNIHSYEAVSKFGSDFLDKNFEHPMILTMNSKDTSIKSKADFRIYYISQKLASSLGYKTSELLGEDCNKLLPISFAEQHSIAMKKKLFLNEKILLPSKGFVITSDFYYLKMNLTFGLINSLTKDTLIICDINIVPQDESCYLFITDIETNVITMTKNFAEKFNINFQMINRLNITMTNLFSLTSLTKAFANQLQLIDNQKNESVDNILNVFSSNSYINVLKAYDVNTDMNFRNDSFFIGPIYKRKSKVALYLQKIKKDIEELEYDDQWLNWFDILEKDWRGRTADDVFSLKIKLHKIGNLPYFYIEVYDQNQSSSSITAHNRFLADLKTENGSPLSGGDTFKKYATNYNNKVANYTLNQSMSLNNSSSLNDTNHQLISGNKLNKKINSNKQSKLLFKNMTPPSKEINEAEIAEFIIQHKCKERIIAFILLFSMLAISVLFLYTVFLKTSKINQLEDYFGLIFNMIKFKEAVLETALLIISDCFTSENLDPNPYSGVDLTTTMLRDQLFARSIEMFGVYNNFTVILNKYHYLPEINDIIQVFKAELIFTSLNHDYSIITYKTSFEKEVYNFHYDCANSKFLINPRRCNVIDVFLGKEDYPIGSWASDDEIFFYYVTRNIPWLVLTTVNQITTQSNEFIISKTKQAKLTFMTLNITLLVIGTIIPTSIIMVVALYKTKLAFYLNIFLGRNDKVQLVQAKIRHFKIVLMSFDETICKSFEFLKNSEDIALIESSLKGIDFKEDNEVLSSVKQEHDDKVDKSNDTDTDKEKEKGKSKKTKNITNLNNKKKSASSKKIIEPIEDDTPTLQSLNILSLRILRISILLVLICLMIFLSLMIGNLLSDIKLLNDIELVKEMSFTYIDRTPSLNELILFYRVSILYNNTELFNVSSKDYDKYLFRFIITNITVDTNDRRYHVLQDSSISFVYYKTTLEYKMIQYFETFFTKNLLPQRKEYTKAINLPSGSCTNYVDNYIKYRNKELDTFEPEFLLAACLSLEEGKIDNGLSNYVKYYLDYLFNDFVEFALAKNRTKSYLLNELTSKNYIAMFKMMTFIYDISSHVSIFLVDQDLNKVFENTRIEEMSFLFSLLVFCGVAITLFIVFLFGTLKRKTDSFGVIIDKIKDSLI